MRSLLWAFGVFVVAAFAVGCGGDQPSEESTAVPVASPTTAAVDAPPESPTPAPPVREAVVTIAAVGDLMLGRSVGQRIVNDGPGAVFEEPLATRLSTADLTVGNLEAPISDRGAQANKSYTFRAPPTAAEALALAGFDVVSLANNHSLDYGLDALADTFAYLNGHALLSAGAGMDQRAARAPIIVERHGLKIGVVGLVDAGAEGDFSRAHWEAMPGRPGVAWADLETVAETISRTASQADIVVAMLHFGVEYAGSPTESQRELARAAIDAGASLVIGSHPHVLQEVEQYRKGLIAYSLGNFVFDGFDGTANRSAILTVTISANGVESWALAPVEIDANGLPHLSEP